MRTTKLNLPKLAPSFTSSKPKRSPNKKSSIWATQGTNKYFTTPKWLKSMERQAGSRRCQPKSRRIRRWWISTLLIGSKNLQLISTAKLSFKRLINFSYSNKGPSPVFQIGLAANCSTRDHSRGRMKAATMLLQSPASLCRMKISVHQTTKTLNCNKSGVTPQAIRKSDWWLKFRTTPTITISCQFCQKRMGSQKSSRTGTTPKLISFAINLALESNCIPISHHNSSLKINSKKISQNQVQFWSKFRRFRHWWVKNQRCCKTLTALKPSQLNRSQQCKKSPLLCNPSSPAWTNRCKKR